VRGGTQIGGRQRIFSRGRSMPAHHGSSVLGQRLFDCARIHVPGIPVLSSYDFHLETGPPVPATRARWLPLCAGNAQLCALEMERPVPPHSKDLA
jgi:hypothetical protein